MASSQDYLLFVLELLRNLSGITYRKMMGEFILYKDNVIFGGVYDNRFLVKKTKSNNGLKEQLPYEGGSMMYLVDSEDPDEIEQIVRNVINDLSRGGK